MSGTGLLLDAEDYHCLLEPVEQAAIMDWIDRVAPGRWVLTLEVVAEGKVRLLTVPKDQSAIEIVLWGSHGGDVVSKAIYTSEEPPQCAFAAMARR